MRNFSRRGFLFTSLGATRLLRAAGKVPVAVQLYSVRRLCATDLPGTVAGVAKLGYQGVEFAGYFNHGAKKLRGMLDSDGLKCCGTHIGIDALLGDALPKTVEFNQTIGNRNLIVPGFPEQYRKSAAAWRDTAKLFDEI